MIAGSPFSSTFTVVLRGLAAIPFIPCIHLHVSLPVRVEARAGVCVLQCE
jgi:hypothetical protein